MPGAGAVGLDFKRFLSALMPDVARFISGLTGMK
jgi:hypothetical protein